jgi:hypothetical protein
MLPGVAAGTIRSTCRHKLWVFDNVRSAASGEASRASLGVINHKDRVREGKQTEAGGFREAKSTW